MNRASGLICLIVLAAASYVGVDIYIDRSHYATHVRAVTVARTTRYGPGNHTRIEVWFTRHRPNARLSWREAPRTLLADEVPIHLVITGSKGDDIYPFSVHLETRRLRPVGAPTEALVDRVRRWARSVPQP